MHCKSIIPVSDFAGVLLAALVVQKTNMLLAAKFDSRIIRMESKVQSSESLLLYSANHRHTSMCWIECDSSYELARFSIRTVCALRQFALYFIAHFIQCCSHFFINSSVSSTRLFSDRCKTASPHGSCGSLSDADTFEITEAKASVTKL